MKQFILTLSGIIFICSFPSIVYSQNDLLYTDAKKLTITGKPMRTLSVYHRVDTAKYSNLPKEIKRLSTNPTGLAICFSTNSTKIVAKWCVKNSNPLSNLTPIAHKGLDLYIKKGSQWQYAGSAKPNKECNQATIVSDMDKDLKECVLYLPLYDELLSLEIGIQNNASIHSLPSPFEKRIVIYGSSIVQGASASRPGIAYPAIMSRGTGLNFINLGFSGAAKMEKEVAYMLSDLQADAFILDCVPNTSPKDIKERTKDFVLALRKQHPSIPVIFIQSVIREAGNFNQTVANKVMEQNKSIEREVLMLKEKGIKDLYLIKENNFLGQDHEGTVDGVHPNDVGFERMLSAIQPEILSILCKYDIVTQ